MNGNMTDLGTLGGATSGGAGIDNAGEVVGFSNMAVTQNRHAFLYTGGVMQDLQTLGGTDSQAAAINNSTMVVGSSKIAPGSTVTHGFLYLDGTMYDLADLVVPEAGLTNLFQVNGINDSGQIVAFGTLDGGSAHALLLTPRLVVPSITRLQNGHAVVTGKAFPNRDVNIQSVAGLPGTFVTIATVTADADGTFQYEDPNSSSVTKQFYRATLPTVAHPPAIVKDQSPSPRRTKVVPSRTASKTRDHADYPSPLK
jgi:probable HAF family extracellular repeat protein